MHLTKVIKRPIITEKSHSLVAKANEYTFKVDIKATKTLIKKAIEELFKVNVLKVRVINVPSRTTRTGKRRQKVKVSGFKKAIVRLGDKDKLPFFEEAGKKEKK